MEKNEKDKMTEKSKLKKKTEFGVDTHLFRIEIMIMRLQVRSV